MMDNATREMEKQMEQMRIMMAKQQEIRTNCYRHLNRYARKGQIVFAGSSLAEQFPVSEMLQNYDKRYIVYNRGVSGDITDGLLTRMDECIFDLEPSKLFINIGTNDMNGPEYSQDKLMANYEKILRLVHERLPKTKVHLLSYYPVNPDLERVPAMQREMMFKTRTNQSIREANKAVAQLAEKLGDTYINLFDILLDDKGRLREDYTQEGMHMWPNAYKVILDALIPYFEE
jgi:lysophospholipase L1-like esterase